MLGADFWHTESVERLGIPSVMVTDGPHGLPATCFPTAAGMGASWNRDLIRRVGEPLGTECQAANIKRSPLCGRNFE